MSDEAYGAALLVTPFDQSAPAVPVPTSPAVDRIISLAMLDTAVIKSVDDSAEAESNFRTEYNAVRDAGAKQGLRFNWSLFRSPSGRLHFQYTQYKNAQRKPR